MYEKSADNILAGYRVLDLAGAPGALCLKLLKNMGAIVILADPGKDPARFRELVTGADIIVESTTPGLLASLGFSYAEISKMNPRLIMASITPFGQNGPHKDLKASDLTLQAMGGWLSVTGEADRPLKLTGNQAYNTASLFAMNGILLALHQRHETDKGQHIDVSILECVAATLDHVLVRYYYEGVISERQGSRTWNNTFDILPCKDGFILISIHRQWETLAALMAVDGMADDLAEVKWQDRETRNAGIGHIIEVLGRWTLKLKADELEELGQLMHFPWAAVKREK
jgi:crotonobetainyl-CoA:carnitine CoA-transferase CaiB-like acyl-CoA transferase